MMLPVTTFPQLWPFSSYCIRHLAKDCNVVLLSYCLAWRSVLLVDNTFMILKNRQHGLDIALTLLCLLWTWQLRWLPLGRLGFCFRVIAMDPWPISDYDLFGEIWVFVRGSSMSCVTSVQNSFCTCDRSCRTNFATTRFLPRYSIKISETIVCGIPRSSSNSCTVNRWFSLIAAGMHSTFSGVLLVEGLSECGLLLTDSRPSLKRRYHNFIWASLNESSPKAFLIMQTVSADECPSLKQNLMQIRWSTRPVIVNVTVTQYTSSLKCLTATWLAPCKSNCSRMRSKVSSDWLPSYIKAMWPVLEIFKMAEYFPDRPRIIKWVSTSSESISCLCSIIQVKPSHVICAAKVLWHYYIL